MVATMTGERPDVAIIIIDALRYDCVPGAPASVHLRAAQASLPALPAFSRLVHGAHQFTQAVACAPYTPAALATLFTGLVPPEHGVRAHAATALNPDVRTLAAILSTAGYRTCFMNDYPDIVAPVGILKDAETTVSNETDALSWWDAFAGTPRFLVLHLWDVHKPYDMPVRHDLRGDYRRRVAAWQARLDEHNVATPPDLYRQVHAEAERHQVNVMQCLWEEALGWQAGLEGYLSGLQTFDCGRLRQLADNLATRGVLDQALVVITSDHGEGRSTGIYGRLNHSTALLDDVIRIPLFMRVPGIGAGTAIGRQVSQADIAPTLLDALGLLALRTPVRSGCGGRSLMPCLRGQDLPPAPAYAEISRARPTHDPADPLPGDPPSIVYQRMLRYPQRKIVLTGQMAKPDDEMLHAPTEVFVRRLYRDILGRFEGAGGLAWWLATLDEKDGKPNVQRRREAVRAFAESPEATSTPKHAIYDLGRDALEEHPRTPATDPLFWLRYRSSMRVMEEIERGARPGAPLLPAGSDEEIVAQRLQALGYIE